MTVARGIRCPVLVLRGERSRVFSTSAAAELAAVVGDGRWEEVAGAGHTIQSSNPRGLAEAVHRFLDRLGLPATHTVETSRTTLQWWLASAGTTSPRRSTTRPTPVDDAVVDDDLLTMPATAYLVLGVRL